VKHPRHWGAYRQDKFRRRHTDRNYRACKLFNVLSMVRSLPVQSELEQT